MTHAFPSCDGVRRRDVLKVGFAGALGFSVGLPDLLCRQARTAQSPQTVGAHMAGKAGRDVSLVIVYLQGGPSTIDIFDLKPEAPPEFRGEFRPIDTRAPGLQICEH